MRGFFHYRNKGSGGGGRIRTYGTRDQNPWILLSGVIRKITKTVVKSVFKKEIITPGIRFNSKTDDQKRVLTPKQAFKNGADWCVIGRNITKGNIKKNIQSLIKHLNQ